MKRNQRASSSPALPTVRALPPQRRRLADTPGLRPVLRIAGGVVIALVILGGAFGAVVALERGTLPPVVIPLASLSVLAATAAFLAGRAEGKKEIASSAGRSRAKGRLQKGQSAAGRAVSGAPASAAAVTSGTDASAGAAGALLAQQAHVALQTKFLDEISRALRAPITSICLAARIIRKHYDSTPEVVAHFGDTLLAEADRLGQTVDEFLELARLESGLVEWHEEEVDAADLIQRAVAEVEPVAVSYGVSVAFTMEPGLPPMHADRERVTQALTILLAMTVRAASEGSEIVIQIAGAHRGWVFTVGGTSFVYPHAEARKVHVRSDGVPAIEQVESGPDGAGLGLCVCREIVTCYQGRLWIEGTPGTSGCVRFTIPYRQHRRATTGAAASAASATSAPAVPHVERPHTATAAEAVTGAGASVAAGDLEQRREMAVKALQERAAVQPRAGTADSEPQKADESSSTDSEGKSLNAQSETTTHLAADSAAPDAPSASTTPETVAVVDEKAAETPCATEASEPETSSGHPHADVDATTETAVQPEPAAAQSDVRAACEESPVMSAAANDAKEEEASLAESEDAELADVEVEVEIDDAPVQEPVSGTMITATHRTAGPPVLATPGVPALRSVQSAASAAIQGSDDLLLEIAEAQSPDGRSLIVSEEVRSLLASAPGTLPAVAGQNAVAGGGRGTYTPSRRRMVQAPWVVRPGTDAQPDAPQGQQPDTPAPGQANEPPAPGQRARLNERLAKRLGLTGGSQPGRGEGRPGGAGGAGAYMRSRRLGSR